MGQAERVTNPDELVGLHGRTPSARSRVSSHNSSADEPRVGGGQSPQLPMLIFDGDCGFCTNSARWGQRRLGLTHVAPWQSLDLRAYGVSAERCSQAVQWVSSDGRVDSGADAVAMALRSGSKWARLGGRFLQMPGVRQVAAGVYALVSANRYRLPGSTDACRL